MLKFRDLAVVVASAAAMMATPAAADGDVANGKAVFKRCAYCHAVGSGATNKLGPHLNNLLGRKVGSLPGYSYSQAMKNAGSGNLVWSAETLDAYLENPKTFIKGTKKVVAGLARPEDRADVIAYLRTFTQSPAGDRTTPATQPTPADKPATATQKQGSVNTTPVKHGVFHLGRPATAAEIAAWDIDVRPDGVGLPKGRGTVARGEVVYSERCASCHGDFGEGRGRWPALAGGFDSLKAERPVKTIGSYWPYLSTVFDYVRRTMPYGDARSLTNDDVYAVTAYLLNLNGIVDDPNFALSSENFTKARLPNEKNFYDDDRAAEPFNTKKGDPCMNNCAPAPAKVTTRAGAFDVTPDSDVGNNKSKGAVD